MAALPGIKYDDGSGAYVTNCFPVRSINSISEEGTAILYLYFVGAPILQIVYVINLYYFWAGVLLCLC